MKLFISTDGSADAVGVLLHNEGCCCADCSIYDVDKRPSVDLGDAGRDSDFAPPVLDRADVGNRFVVSTLGEASTGGLVFSIGEFDYAPPTGVLFADTVPGDTTSLVNLPIGAPINGEIETLGDHDWYRITLTAGQTYTFTVGATGTGDITDSHLFLRSSTGALLADNDDIAFPGNTYSRIVFTAATTGTYFVDVGAWDNRQAGNYRLTATTDIADSIPGSSATTATVTVGGSSVNGVIDALGDHDWYRVDLVAGQSYILRTNATGGANDPDTFLRLFNPAGTTQLAENDDGGGGTYSSIRFTASTSGTYFLDVGSFEDGEAGNYNISVSIAPPLPVFTNDQIADQLVNGFWGGPQNARHFNVAPGGTITFNVTALTADGANLAREAFNLWSDATGITFSEIVGTANITLDDNQTGAFASSTRSGNIITSSIVNVGTGWIGTYGTGLNTYSFQTYIHEIGHAIGLGHAGPYNGSADYGQDNSYLNDAWATTVMSYFSQDENTFFSAQGFTRQFVVSPIVADILATSLAYGAPAATTRTGDTVYGFNNTSGRAIYDATQFPSVTYTIVDHGGTDTLDYSGFTQNQRIDLNAEAFSNIGARVGNVTIARGSLIENAIGGSGNDTINGNGANNVLDGRGGTNQLFGNGGNDSFLVSTPTLFESSVDGGLGTDTLSVTGNVSFSNGFQGASGGTLASIEVVVLNAGANLVLRGAQIDGLALDTQFSGSGTVTVDLQTNVALGVGQFSGSAFGFAGGSSVQFVVNGTADTDVFKGANTASTINGGDGGDQIRGSSAVDTIFGGDGNDKISGVLGADIITGGAGADRFRYGSIADSGLGAGADRIMDFVSGLDTISLAAIDADPIAPGKQGLTYIGTAALANTGSGQLRYSTSGGDILVEADFNGDGVADMHIVLVGLGGGALTSADFLL